jgi:ABC-type antimicrobial peptide transport system permease subunit
MFAAKDVAQAASVVVLGYDVAQKLFPEGGAVGAEIVLKAERFRVVGTFQEKGHIGFESFDNRVFMPLPAAQRIFDFPYIHVVAIRHPDGMDSAEVVAAAKADLAAAKGVELEQQDEFQVFSMKELSRTMQGTFRIFAVVLLSVSSVALIVAGILIMTVMLMSVMEQTREIGVRRAVGARRRDILVQFLTETLLQVFGGQVLGFILGIAGVWIVCVRAEWPFFITAQTVFTALFFSLLVGILFGLLPAYRAATLDPVDSLRYE